MANYPDFEVIITNQTARPSVGAVDRVAEDTVFEISDDGFHTQVVDAGNVMMASVDIPPESFESYDVGDGAFGVDIERLSDALSDIHKSDLVQIEGDGDDRTISVIDLDSGETVDELNMIDPDALREQPDIPDLAWTTSVEVPGDQFSRIVRATREVGSFITLGVVPGGGRGQRGGDMEFRTYTEGDVDEVIGYPDHEFTDLGEPRDGIASVYSLDYINDIRLAVDRPASTDVTFRFPGSEFPVRVDFDVGNQPQAHVQMILSPRIQSEGASQAVNDLARWEADTIALESPDFIADADGGRAKQLFGLFTTFADEYKLLVNDLGMEMRAVDPSNVALNTVEADPQYFDGYQEIDGFPQDPIGLGERHTADLLAKWRQNDDFEFGHSKQTRMAAIKHDIFTARLATIDPDSIRQEPDIPTLEVTSESEVDAASLDSAIHRATGVSDHIVVLVTDGSFYILGLGDDTNVIEEVESVDVQGQALSLLSGDYSTDMTDTLPQGDGETVTVRAGYENPVVFAGDTGGDSLSYTYTISPRVIGEDSDVIPDIQDAMADEPVDLDWADDEPTTDFTVDAFSGMQRESIEERMRKERLSTFPIDTRVTTTSYPKDGITTVTVGEVTERGFQGERVEKDLKLEMDDSDDMAVPEDSIRDALEEIARGIRFDFIDSTEVVADVTYEDEDTYTIDYRNIQPDAEYSLNTLKTDDINGVRMTRLTSQDNNYAYTSDAIETPSRYQVLVRATEDPDGEGYSVFVGLKGRGKTAEGVVGTPVSSGHPVIADAYAEMVDYIENTDIEEMVREAGAEVTLSNYQLRDELKSVISPYVDYSLEGKPGSMNPEQEFFATIKARQNIFPDAYYTVDISAMRPDGPEDGYDVRYVLSFEATGPGDARVARDLASRTVGEAETRDEIPELVDAAIEEIRSFGDVYARTERDDAPPRAPGSLPGVREGQVREWADAYLPAPRAELEDELRNLGLPVELTDVDRVGPARAEEIQEKGIEDMLDLVSLLGTTKRTFIGDLMVSLPDRAEGNLRDAAKEIWEEVIWPKRDAPEGFDTPEPEPEPDPDEADTEGVALPEGVDPGRYDFGVFAQGPDADYPRFEVRVFANDDRKTPDVEVTDDIRDDAASNASNQVDPWMFEPGDLVALGSVSERVRRGPTIASFSMGPAVETVEPRIEDADGDLAITPEDEWQPVTPLHMNELEPGDLVTDFTTAPVREVRSAGVVVGWDIGNKYLYQRNSQSSYLIYRWDEDAEQINPDTTRDKDWVGQRAMIGAWKKPADDDFAGLVPDTDQGFGPMEPFWVSDLPEGVEYEPFIRSRDELEELVGEDIHIRTTSGWVYDTELAGMAAEGACAYVPEYVVPEGEYCIPASSDHKDSAFDIIAIPGGEEPEPEETTEDTEDTTTGEIGADQTFRSLTQATYDEARAAVESSNISLDLTNIRGISDATADELGEIGIENTLDLALVWERDQGSFVHERAQEIIQTRFHSDVRETTGRIMDDVIDPLEQAITEEMEAEQEPEAEVTVVSPNRPLTRGARDDLQEYGIVFENPVQEPGRQTVVGVEERPPVSVLEEHELFIEEDPIEVWETDSGETVKIYQDVVISDGETLTLSPEEAASEAREQDRFSPVELPDDTPFATKQPDAEDEDVEGFADKRMENAFYWAAQLAGWMKDGPNAGLGGRYYVEVAAGQPILVFDDSWTEQNVQVIRDSLREYNFPQPMRIREQRDGGFRLFITEPSDDRLKSNYVEEWRDWEPHTDFSDTEPDRGSDEPTEEEVEEEPTPDEEPEMSQEDPFPIRVEAVFRETDAGAEVDIVGPDLGPVEGTVVNDVLDLLDLVAAPDLRDDGDVIAEIVFTAPDEYEFEDYDNPLQLEAASDFDGGPPGEDLDTPMIDPEEMWRAPGGEVVEIYPDSVYINGIEVSIDPEDAKFIVRENEAFNRLRPIGEDADTPDEDEEEEDEDLPEPDRPPSGDTGPPATEEPDEPTAFGIRLSNLKERLDPAFPGVIVSIETRGNVVEILQNRDPGSTVEFGDLPGTVNGDVSDLEDIVVEAAQEYNRAVDPEQIDVERVNELRLDISPKLPAVPEPGEEPEPEPEPEQQPEQQPQQPQQQEPTGPGEIPPGSVLGQADDPGKAVASGQIAINALSPQEIRAVFPMVASAQVSQEDRAAAMEAMAAAVFPESLDERFSVLRLNINFGLGGGVSSIEVAADVATEYADQIAGAGLFANSDGNPVIRGIASNPTAEDIIGVVAHGWGLLNEENEEHRDLHESLNAIDRVTERAMFSGGFDLRKLFIRSEQVRKFGPTFLMYDNPEGKSPVLAKLQALDYAFVAAQRVYVLQTGGNVREDIENDIGGFPSEGTIGWHLDQALDLLDQGQFDPVSYVRNYIKADDRLVPSDFFTENQIPAPENMNDDPPWEFQQEDTEAGAATTGIGGQDPSDAVREYIVENAPATVEIVVTDPSVSTGFGARIPGTDMEPAERGFNLLDEIALDTADEINAKDYERGQVVGTATVTGQGVQSLDLTTTPTEPEPEPTQQPEPTTQPEPTPRDATPGEEATEAPFGGGQTSVDEVNVDQAEFGDVVIEDLDIGGIEVGEVTTQNVDPDAVSSIRDDIENNIPEE